MKNIVAPRFLYPNGLIICVVLNLLAFATRANILGDTTIIRPGIHDDKISTEWKNALTGRMDPARIDSLGWLQRSLTPTENEWKEAIISKKEKWNGFKDSLSMPFNGVSTVDTLYILLGYQGNDDGFTFGYNTVCLDLTALVNAYGSVQLADNDNRIDRIFSHEFTHLLHKQWAAKMHLTLPAFRDSVLWECFYEGLGMYRSLNPKWLPANKALPAVTTTALENLYPVFVDRVIKIELAKQLSATEKAALGKNLSRGNVNEKWGAFPVAIWLALEADGDDTRLSTWIDKGPSAVILLAKKYLPGQLIKKISAAF